VHRSTKEELGREPVRAWGTSLTRTVDATPLEVEALVRDGTTWSTWQPEILSSEGSSQLEPGDVVRGEAEMLGFRVAGRADILRSGGGEVAQDVIVGIKMRVTYRFEHHEDGTAVTHTLEADLPRGISGRVLSAFLRYRLKRMQRRLLENLDERHRR
jgi:hypothetical protein